MDCFWIKDSITDTKLEDLYETGKEIGRSPFQVEGALSVVLACYDKKSKRSFAVNVMKKKVGVCVKFSEIAIFLKLDHRNVMRIKEVFETYTHINIVREHITGKQLFQNFVDGGPYSESKVGSFMHQTLKGLRYLHEHSIIHGNLKSENILVEEKEDHTFRVIVCDHIQSKIMHYDLYRLAIIASPSLCPPEILLSQLRTPFVDMWAIGIITFILLFGHDPFYRDRDIELYRAVIHANFSYQELLNAPSNCTFASKDFINRLLIAVPERRMSVVDALLHPWINISTMKAQSMDDVYGNFKDTKEALDNRLNEKVMADIRRAREIFEKLVLQMPYRNYSEN